MGTHNLLNALKTSKATDNETDRGRHPHRRPSTPTRTSRSASADRTHRDHYQQNRQERSHDRNRDLNSDRRGKSPYRREQTYNQRPRPRIVCNYCYFPGHVWRECRRRLRDEERQPSTPYHNYRQPHQHQRQQQHQQQTSWPTTTGFLKGEEINSARCPSSPPKNQNRPNVKLTSTYLGTDDVDLQLTERNFVKGRLPSGKNIFILFDSGATRTIVSANYVKSSSYLSSLPQQKVRPVRFRIGNGQFLFAYSMIKMHVVIQSHKFEIFALIVENLVGIDMLLGSNTLSDLNGVLHHVVLGSVY